MRGGVLALFWLIAKIVLLLAGLLFPGAALARALRVPQNVATCFAGSAVSLFATVLALQFASIQISLVSLTSGLALIAATAFIAARLVRGGTGVAFISGPSLLSGAGLRRCRERLGR